MNAKSLLIRAMEVKQSAMKDVLNVTSPTGDVQTCRNDHSHPRLLARHDRPQPRTDGQNVARPWMRRTRTRPRGR